MSDILAVEETTARMKSRSIDVWILDTLRTNGMQTLDRLQAALPHVHRTRLFFAIDRLSRSGVIAIRRPEQQGRLISVGEYLASTTVLR